MVSSKAYPSARAAMEDRADKAVWRAHSRRGHSRRRDVDGESARRLPRAARRGGGRGVRQEPGRLPRFPPERREDPIWKMLMEEDE